MNEDTKHISFISGLIVFIFRTPLSSEANVSKILEAQFRSVDEDILSSYGDEYMTKTKDFALKLSRAGSYNAEPVINEIELALTQKYPKHVYRPRRNIFTKFFWSFLELLPYSVYENFIFLLLKILDFPHPNHVENDAHSTKHTD